MKKLTAILMLIAIFTIVNSNNVMAEIYQSPLISWWRLDNNDLSGTTLTDRGSAEGTTVITSNATTTGYGGPVGQSFYFNGVDTYVDTGKTYATQLSAGTTTVALWLRKDTTSAVTQTAFQMNYTTARNALRISASSVILAVYRGTAGTAATFTSSVTANNNKWNHVVASLEGNRFTVYINGKMASTSLGVEFPTTVSGTDKNAHIGATYLTPTRSAFWKGAVDDVRVYNRALSADEAAQIYNQGLVQHWLFNNF